MDEPLSTETQCISWCGGRGVGVNRKVDMTLGDSRLQLHGLSNTNEGGFLCFWALLQRSFHQNGSDHGREIHVSFGGGWSRSSDTLTWLKPPLLSLQGLCITLAWLQTFWIWLQQNQQSPKRSLLVNGLNSWFSVPQGTMKGAWPLAHVKKVWSSLERGERQLLNSLIG